MKIIVSIFFTAVITIFFTISYLKTDNQSLASYSSGKSSLESTVESNTNDKQSPKNVNYYDSTSVKSNIDSLIETQTALLNTLNNMNNRLTTLENRLNQIEPQTASSTQPLTRPNTEAQLQAAISDSNARQEFMQAENTFYSQSVDSTWDAKMTSALQDVETALRSAFEDSVYISEQECRSDSCRVEFSLERDNINLHPLMLAAQGSSKMFFDEQIVNGQKKAIVIYQR